MNQRPPNRPGGSSLGQPMNQQMAKGGNAAQSIPGLVPVTIVRDVPSKVQSNPSGALAKNPGNTAVITLMNRWDSGDPAQARPIRLTMSGVIPVKTGGSGAPGEFVWGMMALVEWGSQSGAVQKIWMPVPCDFDLCATYVQVSAAITQVPYMVPPNAFNANNIPLSGQGQILVSFSEGTADGPSAWNVGYATALVGGYSQATPKNSQGAAAGPYNVIVTDVLFASDPTIATTQSWVGVLDRPPGYVPTVLFDLQVGDYFVKVPISPGQTVSMAYDKRPFFAGVLAYAVTSPGAGMALDTTNGPGISVEVRGYVPGIFGLQQPNPTT